VVKLNECAGVEEVIHRCQGRSSRSAMIVSDQEVGSLAVILRISSCQDAARCGDFLARLFQEALVDQGRQGIA
jgi:hypothetical protein